MGDHQEKYIDRLAEVVAIKSVSAWPEARDEVVKMMNWMKTKLEGTFHLEAMNKYILASFILYNELIFHTKHQ